MKYVFVGARFLGGLTFMGLGIAFSCSYSLTGAPPDASKVEE